MDVDVLVFSHLFQQNLSVQELFLLNNLFHIFTIVHLHILFILQNRRISGASAIHEHARSARTSASCACSCIALALLIRLFCRLISLSCVFKWLEKKRLFLGQNCSYQTFFYLDLGESMTNKN